MIANKNEIVNKLVLEDVNPNTGKKYDWQGLKLKSLDVADTFRAISADKNDLYFMRRGDKISSCSNFLEFRRYFVNNERKLHKGYFCKDSLCPGCMVRRSRKIYGQVAKVMDLAIKDYEFIFLTLTVKNCEPDKLGETIDLMFNAWHKMFMRKAIKTAFKGYFRALEVTHNTDVTSPSYDTYHPHFHVILAVNKSYFKKKDYLNQKQLKDIWKSCLGVDYDPVVDVRRFRTSSNKERAKSLAEAAKYTVKDSDYLIEDDFELTKSSVYILSLALKRRRLIAFGGKLKDIHKALNLDDPLDGDLINTDNEDEDMKNLDYIIETFRWGVGLTGELNYFLWDIATPDFSAR
jgi:plasmid rolling circle replication initiator protein Rep